FSVQGEFSNCQLRQGGRIPNKPVRMLALQEGECVDLAAILRSAKEDAAKAEKKYRESKIALRNFRRTGKAWICEAAETARVVKVELERELTACHRHIENLKRAISAAEKRKAEGSSEESDDDVGEEEEKEAGDEAGEHGDDDEQEDVEEKEGAEDEQDDGEDEANEEEDEDEDDGYGEGKEKENHPQVQDQKLWDPKQAVVREWLQDIVEARKKRPRLNRCGATYMYNKVY
ncbi:hypothetical protein HK101_004108, partial [Irineochytrium annulatum]